MSQVEAQRYRRTVRAQLDDELLTHDPATCQYCALDGPCIELHYAERAAEIVERRLARRTVGGPS